MCSRHVLAPCARAMCSRHVLAPCTRTRGAAVPPGGGHPRTDGDRSARHRRGSALRRARPSSQQAGARRPAREATKETTGRRPHAMAGARIRVGRGAALLVAVHSTVMVHARARCGSLVCQRFDAQTGTGGLRPVAYSAVCGQQSTSTCRVVLCVAGSQFTVGVKVGVSFPNASALIDCMIGIG